MVGERLICKLAVLDNCQPVNSVNFSPVTCTLLSFPTLLIKELLYCIHVKKVKLFDCANFLEKFFKHDLHCELEKHTKMFLMYSLQNLTVCDKIWYILS